MDIGSMRITLEMIDARLHDIHVLLDDIAAARNVDIESVSAILSELRDLGAQMRHHLLPYFPDGWTDRADLDQKVEELARLPRVQWECAGPV